MKYLNREMLHGNAETLVLALLVEKGCHGYRLRQELAARSHDYFQMGFGRLYPLLRSMERRRLVTARRVRVGKSREQRRYAITARGLAELRERKRRWRQFCAAMEHILSVSNDVSPGDIS
jgi:PadR family transcriptional regulator, regulatory protein PadR